MRKKDFIDVIWREFHDTEHIQKRQVELILTSFLDHVVTTVFNGDSVRLVGFGEFKINYEKNRGKQGPNSLDKQYFFRFKTSRVLRERLKELSIKHQAREKV